MLVCLSAGCGGAPKHTARSTPPRDVPPPTATRTRPVPASEPNVVVSGNGKALYTEVGRASWYGPGFQHRHAANGEIFDMNRMSAAHLTIPLNSIVRVTNIKTGESVVLPITDRGPFVSDRVIDLSKAAAEKTGVYGHGGAMVKIEVLESPAPVRAGGKWCVQIGAFSKNQDATALKAHLVRRYPTSRVLQFPAPDGGEWLRIRVPEDDKHRAEEVIKEITTLVGVFLVRLD